MSTSTMIDARKYSIAGASVGDVVIASDGIAYTILKITSHRLGQQLTLEKYETSAAGKRRYKQAVFAIRHPNGDMSPIREY